MATAGPEFWMNLQRRHDGSVVISERGDLIEEEVALATTADS